MLRCLRTTAPTYQPAIPQLAIYHARSLRQVHQTTTLLSTSHPLTKSLPMHFHFPYGKLSHNSNILG
jgi:hypothetical protein